MCSNYCLPGSCSGVTSNDCSACPTNWTPNATQCQVDPLSNYTLITTSTDISAGGNIVVSPSNSLFCGSYWIYGEVKCIDSFRVVLASGVGVGYYAYEVVVWVIVEDHTTWSSSEIMSISDGSTSQQYSMGSYDGQEDACYNSKLETYYRLVWSKSQ